MDYLFKCWTTVLTTPQHGHSGSCRDGLSFHLCPHMVIFCLIEEEDLKTLNWRSLSSYSASLCRSAHFSSGTQSYLTLCKPMDYSTPGFPVRHQLLELAQPHVHWIGDAIQPSHPLSSPSPSALNLSHHQGHFQWVLFLTSGGQSIGASASASDLQISLQSHGLSRIFSNTTVQKHQFFGTQLSLCSKSHIHTWLLEKP